MTRIIVERAFLDALAKHLPPSASSLRLLDIDGAAGAALRETRGDLERLVVESHAAPWVVRVGSADAVVGANVTPAPALLASALEALRPGGRLVLVDSERQASGALVETLEAAGFTRILVEPALPDGRGVLFRGEKPHVTADTLARIGSVASRDGSLLDLDTYAGRYLFLLVRQTPDKPAWSRTQDEAIEWHAAALDRADGPLLLAFSGLPRAVAFLQPAALAGTLTRVKKVAHFRREVARAWPYPAVLNPPPDLLDTAPLTWVPVDPSTAEAPGE